MSGGILVSDLLKEIGTHDKPILDLLMVDRNEMTKIQIANHFKRSRSDVGFSLERLKIGGHIKQAKYNYGKWYAVNYDYSIEIASKRPDESVSKIASLTAENAELRADLEFMCEMSNFDAVSRGQYKKIETIRAKHNKKLLNKHDN